MGKINKWKYIVMYENDLPKDIFNKIINIGAERWFCEDSGELEYHIEIDELLTSLEGKYFSKDEKNKLKNILNTEEDNFGSFILKDKEISTFVIFT